MGERTGHEAPRSARRSRVLELLPDAVFLLDERLEVVDHNGVAHGWLGRPRHVDISDAVHPDDRAVLLAAENEVRASPPGWSDPVPVRVRHEDGSWHTWAIRADNRLRDPDVGAIVLSVKDVTGRLALPTAAADTMLRELVTTAPVASLTLDRKGRVRFAAGAAMLAPPEMLLGQDLRELAESDEQRCFVERALGGERIEEISSWGGRWWHVHLTPLLDEGEVVGVVGVFLDSTDQVLAKQELEATAAHLTGVLESVHEALVVVDEDRCITTSNGRFRSLFGELAVPGQKLSDAVGAAVADVVDAQLGSPGGGPAEVRVKDSDGAPVWLLVSTSAVRTQDGRRVGAVVLLTDITANKDVERRLAVAARTDAATGVLNRLVLGDRMEQALARRGAEVVLLFCDVDGLKVVNDGRGHAAGDVLIRSVAGRISAVLRPSDTLVRYGGDEFVVVCEDLPVGDSARALAERVRHAVAEPLDLGDGREVLQPSISIGIATSPPHHTADALLRAADQAVYEAKAAGGGVVRPAR